MFTKQQAEEIVLREVCGGVREEDIETLRAQAMSSNRKITYRALLSGAYECEHGWIFHNQTGGFKRDGKPIKFIGSGSALAFNRKTGKFQSIGYGGQYSFYVENFRRTGDVDKGCSESTIHLHISDWETEIPIDSAFVSDIKEALINLTLRHVDATPEAINESINSIFPTPRGGGVFFDAKSKLDAREWALGVSEKTQELEESYDVWHMSFYPANFKPDL